MAGNDLQRRQGSSAGHPRPTAGGSPPPAVPWPLSGWPRSRLPLLAGLLAPVLAVVPPRANGCGPSDPRHSFDLIVYGDEPAGLMTALATAAQGPRLGTGRRPRVAVVREQADAAPLGGTISRGGLAYLDRNQLPWDQWIWRLDHLAPSSRLYARFLQLAGTSGVAADPRRVDRGFRAALAREQVMVFSAAGLEGVDRQGARICALRTQRHGSLAARQLIDNSPGADLARRSGVAFNSGLGPGPLASEGLSLGWIFELQGLSLEQLRSLERQLTHRLLDPGDREAQGWLRSWPAFRRHPEALRHALLDSLQQPRVAISWSHDSADQVSPALAIAFHGETGIPPGLIASPVRLDLANIAQLADGLSVNALLLRNDAAQNRRVLAGGSRPLPWMVPHQRAVTAFFRRHGAREVRWSPELYVRAADQIRHPRQSLTVARITGGGVPALDAVGTFTYGLDIRGGLRQRVRLPHGPVTFNVGYRHTLPQEIDNLAVLGPAGGFGGLGVGAGRILELNVTVGQGLACAIGLALDRDRDLAAIDPREVHRSLPWLAVPYGRPLAEAPPQALARSWQHSVTTMAWRLGGSRGSGLAPAAPGQRCAWSPRVQGSRSARG